jgi:hypothetical protein
MADSKRSKPASLSALSFLTLPAEIRNNIYELLFVHADPMVIASTEDSDEAATLHRRCTDRNDGLSVTSQENAEEHRKRHLYLAMPILSGTSY